MQTGVCFLSIWVGREGGEGTVGRVPSGGRPAPDHQGSDGRWLLTLKR